MVLTVKLKTDNRNGRIHLYPLPTPHSFPGAISSGSDGSLWFTEQGTNQIGRITTSGQITEYMIPTANSDPYGIVKGPDGNMWFTEVNGNKIGKITTK